MAKLLRIERKKGRRGTEKKMRHWRARQKWVEDGEEQFLKERRRCGKYVHYFKTSSRWEGRIEWCQGGVEEGKSVVESPWRGKVTSYSVASALRRVAEKNTIYSASSYFQSEEIMQPESENATYCEQCVSSWSQITSEAEMYNADLNTAWKLNWLCWLSDLLATLTVNSLKQTTSEW